MPDPSTFTSTYSTGDTIAAIATAPGRAGLGIVRLSGAQAREIAARVLDFHAEPSWHPWTATLARLTGPGGGAVDRVIVTYFAAPRSYTAEDVVEIACHGAMVVLRHCLARCVEEGARLAGPGEFTLRAFLNGRIDLAQAEAVRDLIEATTLYQAQVAAQQAEGSVSRRIAPLKEQLLELIALLEAGIDFAEDDVSVAPATEILRRVEPLRVMVAYLASSFAYGKLVHDGFTLAIAGKPNAGKSSLFNRLLEQDRAIVTELPGTTRDLVSETLSLEGLPVRLVDTAGIRDSSDRVEKLGIERSYQAIADADLMLVVLDASTPLDATDLSLVERARARGRYLLAANKIDLPCLAELPEEAVRVSALTGEGTSLLRARIRAEVAPPASIESGFITSLRQEQLLKETEAALKQAAAATTAGLPHEMLLFDLYSALRPLDSITGATTADDILNRIFSTFCIGK